MRGSLPGCELSPFFAGVRQRPVEIRGAPGRSPLFFRDVDMMTAVFTADAGAARALLPSGRLEPLSPFPGVALVAIHCFEYKDSDIGPYNEVAITVAVRVDRSSRVAGLARGLLRHTYQGHILQLPVTTEVALHGGIDYFNYPKFMAKIVFDETATERDCSVTDPDTGELYFGVRFARLPVRPARPGGEATFLSYPVIGSELVLARMVVNPLTHGRQAPGRGCSVRIGAHPRSAILAALRPGRVLEVAQAPRCEAILHEPVSLGEA